MFFPFFAGVGVEYEDRRHFTYGLVQRAGSMLSTRPPRGPLSTVRSISSMASSLWRRSGPAVPTKRQKCCAQQLMMSSLEIVPLGCVTAGDDAHGHARGVSISNMSSGGLLGHGRGLLHGLIPSTAVRSTLSLRAMFRKAACRGRIRINDHLPLTPYVLLKLTCIKTNVGLTFFCQDQWMEILRLDMQCGSLRFYRTDRGRLSPFSFVNGLQRIIILKRKCQFDLCTRPKESEPYHFHQMELDEVFHGHRVKPNMMRYAGTLLMRKGTRKWWNK